MDVRERNPWALQEHFFQRLKLIKARDLTAAETYSAHLGLLAEIDGKIGAAIVEHDDAALAAYEQARDYVLSKVS